MKDRQDLPSLGICEWFHYEDHRRLARNVERMRELGVKRLRTGVSWADFHRPRGPQWYAQQASALEEFEVMLSVWHTPPSWSETGACAGPPVRLEAYGEFIAHLLDTYPGCCAQLELWNEPNNLYKWDFARCDPQWEKFSAMIRGGAAAARARGVTTVLGGISPMDPHFVRLLGERGALDEVDIIGVHGFPGMSFPGGASWDWYGNWPGWEARLDLIREVAGGRPIWVTETGLATWHLELERPDQFAQQVLRLEDAASAPAERVYWYSLCDLAPWRPAIEGFHVDENEYHMGLLDHEDRPKPAFARMAELLAEREARGHASSRKASERL